MIHPYHLAFGFGFLIVAAGFAICLAARLGLVSLGIATTLLRLSTVVLIANLILLLFLWLLTS